MRALTTLLGIGLIVSLAIIFLHHPGSKRSSKMFVSRQRDEAHRLSAAGRLREAAEALRKCILIDPTDRSTHVELADMLARTDLWEDGVAEYRGLLESQPTDLNTADKLATVLLDRDLPKEALAIDQVLARARPRAEVLARCAREKAMIGPAQDALEASLACLKNRPNDSWGHFIAGHALLDLGKPREARDHLTQAFAAEADWARLAFYDLVGKHMRSLIDDLARADDALGDTQQAADLWIRSLPQTPRPQTLETLRRIVSCLESQGDRLRAQYYARLADQFSRSYGAADPMALVEQSPSGSTGVRGPSMVECARARGIAFDHVAGPSNLYNPEVNGSGLAVLDFDNDGQPDLYFVNGGDVSMEGSSIAHHPDALFRNRGHGTFERVEQSAGVTGAGMGEGVLAADFDNDGYVDLYLSGLKESLLYHNNGDGTFTERSIAAGLTDPWYATMSAAGDFDRDGWLDIYVGNYVDFDYKTADPPQIQLLATGQITLNTLGPINYRGVPNLLFRNQRNGCFQNVTHKAGVGNNEGGRSKTLGVVFADLNGDGWPDLVVANDEELTAYYRNNRDGTFTDIALSSWLADKRGNMGLALGDVNEDGFLDLLITHWYMETKALYINPGPRGPFTDRAVTAGLTEGDLEMVGWGDALCDLDNDGHLDLIVANGSTIPAGGGQKLDVHTHHAMIAQPMQLWWGKGDGTFAEATRNVGLWSSPWVVGRGLATGDLDNSGWLDVVVSANNGPAQLLTLTNRPPHHWLELELIGTRSNREAVGAHVSAIVDRPGSSPLRITRELLAGTSYLSTESPVIHMGLGDAQRVSALTIRWPSGSEQHWRNLACDRRLRLVEDPR